MQQYTWGPVRATMHTCVILWLQSHYINTQTKRPHLKMSNEFLRPHLSPKHHFHARVARQKQALVSFVLYLSYHPSFLSLLVDEPQPPSGCGFHDNQPASQPAARHDSSSDGRLNSRLPIINRWVPREVPQGLGAGRVGRSAPSQLRLPKRTIARAGNLFNVRHLFGTHALPCSRRFLHQTLH